MKVVLRRLEAMGELSVATDEFLDTDRVTIGRGTDQTVQLPDMRLSLAHSEIRALKDGEYTIESKTRTGVWVNGTPEPSHRLHSGDVIDCGRFRLTVGAPPPDAELLLEIAERISAREEKAQRKGLYLMRLIDSGLSKRRPAWLLAGAVLLAGLVLPLLLRYGFPGSEAGASLDQIWQAGPSSSAHSRFLTDCSACHQQPFQAVRNEACTACHSAIKQHSDRPELQALAGMSDARCGSCHLEHSGRAALHASDPDLCTDCHAKPERNFAAAQLQPARQFAAEHPAFSPRLPRYEAGRGFRHQEVSQDNPAELREDSNLIFPHDVHLDPKGIRAVDGKKVLDCGDCHAPEGRGEGFKPVVMETHCAACHRLDFDPGEPERVLPHAQPAEVARIIRDHYARQALAGEVKDPAAPDSTRLRRVPGEVLNAEQSRAAMQWAEARSARVIDEVFERRVCGGCHTVERTDQAPGAASAPWRVTPVAQTSNYFTGARFDHAAHRTEDCAQCHNAKSSKTSSDLMLPDLASCRGCHGDPGHAQMVPSACADCHSFHTAGDATMDTAPAVEKAP